MCSELLYYSFGDLLEFKLESVLGKTVVTPVGIMKKYKAEYKDKEPKPELEFIFFLDTPPGKHIAYLADEEACRKSATRPKIFNE